MIQRWQLVAPQPLAFKWEIRLILKFANSGQVGSGRPLGATWGESL